MSDAQKKIVIDIPFDDPMIDDVMSPDPYRNREKLSVVWDMIDLATKDAMGPNETPERVEQLREHYMNRMLAVYAGSDEALPTDKPAKGYLLSPVKPAKIPGPPGSSKKIAKVAAEPVTLVAPRKRSSRAVPVVDDAMIRAAQLSPTHAPDLGRTQDTGVPEMEEAMEQAFIPPGFFDDERKK